MSENNIQWTEQQKRAIEEHQKDVLVTASAGTGKTAVLSGRFVDIISDNSISCGVENVLVLTFTDMAAEQMRRRISEQLKDEFLRTADVNLRHQLTQLQAADISTIHSFCKRLITEHFYRLGLDPTFRVIDSDEQKLIKAEVLEETIEWAWQQGNLRAGLGQLLYKRDLRTGDGFLSKVIEISSFLDGVIWRQDWYERACMLAQTAGAFSGETANRQKQIVTDKLNSIIIQLRDALKVYRSACGDGDWLLKCEKNYIQPVVECIELLETGNWQEYTERIRNYKKPTVYRPKEASQLVGELIYNTVKKALEKFKKLGGLAIVNPDYIGRLGATVQLQTKLVVELVRKFDRLYSQVKKTANCLDFADLEHYALKLLSDEKSDADRLAPSQTAMALRNRYKYIFVDEYQDINSVQKAILDLVGSRGNIFVVGDIKQSIYAFRGTRPEIFLKQLEPASIPAKNISQGLRVDLTVNFRSTKGILDFVNRVFSRIMASSFGGIDYDESARLKPAAGLMNEKSTKDKTPVVELHILDKKAVFNSAIDNPDCLAPTFSGGTSPIQQNDDHTLYSNRQLQAMMIAQRIKRMVASAEGGKAEFDIFDKKTGDLRPVEYGDIVILMRSPARRVDDYVQMLTLASVPVSCPDAQGFFEKREISDVLCLLKVLDNTRRDIELAAVLRSPFFNISDNELAKIKLHGREGGQCRNFYDCIVEYSSAATDKLAEKLQNAMAAIERWRTTARRGMLADLIWQVYRQTGFLAFVLALNNGRRRYANLLKLHDRAIQFEGFVSSGGIASLRRFVEFIEKLQQAGESWTSAEPQADVQNAVRIMSVHKSKGLEFPVVFLAELNTAFNKTDIQKDIVVNIDDTLGLQIIDRATNSKTPSLAHQVIAEEKLASGLAEEMRILYVATTRARERLILTASANKSNCRRIISDGFFSGKDFIAQWQLLSCSNHLEWLLYGLSNEKNLHTAFETNLSAGKSGEDLFNIKLYHQKQLDALGGCIDKLKAKKTVQPRLPGTAVEPNLPLKLKKSLSRRYRFDDAVRLPAKCSVTELTHRNDEYIKIDYSAAMDKQPKVIGIEKGGPAKIADARLTGTAAHLVIAAIDLRKPVTKSEVEEVIGKLLADGAITKPAARHINTESIVEFFDSDLGKKAVDTESIVWREWPFSITVPACMWKSENLTEDRYHRKCEQESIIVQGIIDMLVQTSNEVLLIDFKTDNIPVAAVSRRRELYRRQLHLYGLAAETILKTRPVGKWLYFLEPGCAVEVKS